MAAVFYVDSTFTTLWGKRAGWQALIDGRLITDAVENFTPTPRNIFKKPIVVDQLPAIVNRQSMIVVQQPSIVRQQSSIFCEQTVIVGQLLPVAV